MGIAIVISGLLAFVNEERGWKLADAAIPLLYVAWSLWLLGLGVALIA